MFTQKLTAILISFVASELSTICATWFATYAFARSTVLHLGVDEGKWNLVLFQSGKLFCRETLYYQSLGSMY